MGPAARGTGDRTDDSRFRPASREPPVWAVDQCFLGAVLGCMMTCKQVSKGSAYKYYGRQVVVGDGRRARGKSLEQAQEEAGVPSGVWMSRALPAVGLVAGARVTEGQMRNLFGEGLHSDADRIVADRLAAGDSPAVTARAARLGYRVQKWSGTTSCSARPAACRSCGRWAHRRSGSSSRTCRPASPARSWPKPKLRRSTCGSGSEPTAWCNAPAPA